MLGEKLEFGNDVPKAGGIAEIGTRESPGPGPDGVGLELVGKSCKKLLSSFEELYGCKEVGGKRLRDVPVLPDKFPGQGLTPT